MRSGGWLHQRLAWLALCAMVFGAFAPSISKFLAATQGISWVEICSTSGAKRVAIDLGSKKLPEAPMAGDNHCGYCLLQHHSPVIPTDPYTWETATVSTGRLLIGSGGTTVFKRFVRNAHPTRAPPAFS
jgi:hypothetical protein